MLIRWLKQRVDDGTAALHAIVEVSAPDDPASDRQYRVKGRLRARLRVGVRFGKFNGMGKDQVSGEIEVEGEDEDKCAWEGEELGCVRQCAGEGVTRPQTISLNMNRWRGCTCRTRPCSPVHWSTSGADQFERLEGEGRASY